MAGGDASMPAGPTVGIHGGNIIATARALGCDIAELVDMSSNLTPLGMVPGLRETLGDRLAEISYLPETGSETLRRLFAAKHGLSRDQVLVGNGTTEFIYAVPAAVSCRRAVIVNPTYADYHTAAAWAGIEADSFTLRLGDGFRLDLQALGETLQGGELVFICNPNNPTSGLVPSGDLHDFILQHPGARFMVDESYLPFVREPSLLDFPLPDNLFVLCSSSKIYGIPGLRLGFLAAGEANMALLARRRKPWGVNRMAQIAGEFLLQHGDAYVEEVVRYIEQERSHFAAALADLPGVEVVPGAANFILCHLTGAVSAETLRGHMLQHRFMIRNCANFTTLDERFFRLSLKDRESNARCIDLLHGILGAAL